MPKVPLHTHTPQPFPFSLPFSSGVSEKMSALCNWLFYARSPFSLLPPSSVCETAWINQQGDRFCAAFMLQVLSVIQPLTHTGTPGDSGPWLSGHLVLFGPVQPSIWRMLQQLTVPPPDMPSIVPDVSKAGSCPKVVSVFSQLPPHLHTPDTFSRFHLECDRA